MANPVMHFEVLGKDAAALQSFYGDVFEWKIDASNPMNYGMVDNGGEGINGGVGPTMGGGPPAVTFYVMVPDLEKTLAKIGKAGGKTVMEPMDVPGGPTIAQFSDPEGNVIGLLKG